MKQDDIDKRINMPDVDAEWAKFEHEVIRKETLRRLRNVTAWAGGISVAATILLLFVLNVSNNKATEKPLVAQQVVLESPQNKPTTIKANSDVANTPIKHDASQQSSRILREEVVVGGERFKLLTTYADGIKLAEHLLIQPDSASESWEKEHRHSAFYNKLRIQFLMPKDIEFGIEYEPSSQSREWSLCYDSVRHSLIYHKADTNIWRAARNALGEYKKVDGKQKWVFRKYPKSCERLKVKTYSMAITEEQARRLKTMWTEAIGCVEKKKAFILDGTKCEFPIGKLKAQRPDEENPLITFTYELAEAVFTHNVSRKDSLLEDSTLKRIQEAVKPMYFNYDSLIIIVNKQQLPDSLCKLIHHRPNQYFDQKGLMIDKRINWSAHGAKFSSGYDKNCPIMELTTIPDTLSDTYVSLHPEMLPSLHRVSGIVLDENDQPLADAWVGHYRVGPGSVTDSNGHFSFWLPRDKDRLYVNCAGYYPTIRNIQIADTAVIIRMETKLKK